MTLKQLRDKIDTMILNDHYRGDAQVTFKTGINGVEYSVRSVEMAKSNSGLVVARIS